MKTLIAALLLLLTVPLRAQERETEDLFTFDVEESTAPLREWPTPFTKELANRLDWPLEKLEKLEKRGFGRTEMITFVAIARKSSKSWDDLVKQREKSVRLRTMAEEVGLNYNQVFRESEKIKAEVDRKTSGQELSRRDRLAAQSRAAAEKMEKK